MWEIELIYIKVERNQCHRVVTVCLPLASVGTMVNFVALAREHWVNILVPMGFVIGWYLDKQQDQKLTAFRNKSVLFSR